VPPLRQNLHELKICILDACESSEMQMSNVWIEIIILRLCKITTGRGGGSLQWNQISGNQTLRVLFYTLHILVMCMAYYFWSNFWKCKNINHAVLQTSSAVDARHCFDKRSTHFRKELEPVTPFRYIGKGKNELGLTFCFLLCASEFVRVSGEICSILWTELTSGK